MPGSFADRLAAAQRTNRSTLALVMAPRLLQIPLPMQRFDDPFLPFGKAIIAATRDVVCAYIFDLAAYLAVGAAWNMAPLVAFFLLANMLTTPERLYDLAKIDQMSRLETFWHVTLPPLRFTLFVFTCITTVLAMKTFDYIFTETQGGPGGASSVLTYTLYKISFVNLDLGASAAQSVILMIIVIALTAFQFRFVEKRVHYS